MNDNAAGDAPSGSGHATAVPRCPETGNRVVYDVDRHGGIVTIWCPECETLIHVDDEPVG